MCGKSFSGLPASSNLGYFINRGSLGSSIHMTPAASHLPLPNRQRQAHHSTYPLPLPGHCDVTYGAISRKVLFFPLPGKHREGWEGK